MRAKETVKSLETQRNILDQQIDALNEQRGKLCEEHEAAIREMVYEEKLLSQVKWEVSPLALGSRSTIELRPCAKSKKIACDIADMLDSGGWYHFGFDLKEPGCVFRFDDHEVRLILDLAVADIPSFIKNNNLSVDCNNFDQEIVKLQKKVKALREMKRLL